MKRRIFGVAVASIAAFTITINAIPNIAYALEDIPLIGNVVRVLYVGEGIVSGGIVTDGSNIEEMSLQQKMGGVEELVIRFTQEGGNQQFANHFQIQHDQYPQTLIITINGARAFSGAEQLEEIVQNSEWIKEGYRMITLDDSMYRLGLVLAEGATVEVHELANPAQLSIRLSKGAVEENSESVYAIRSQAMIMGEGLAIVEETIMSYERHRILPVTEDRYVLEVGQYSSEEEAKAVFDQLQRNGNGVRWSIELIQ